MAKSLRTATGPRFCATRVALLALLALLLAVGPLQAADRVALVIGNGAYEGRGLTPLPNPANDARAMAETLRSIGFDVIERTDLGIDDMDDALAEFGRRARGAEIGLVYFAGHGLQDQGVNYFMPVDADPRRISSLPRHAVTLDQFMEELDGVAALKIAIFDACRDNGLVDALRRQEPNPSRSAAVTRGLSRPTSKPTESLVSFATAPEAVAEDGVGVNSPFTAALVRHLGTPGKEIRLAFGAVRDSVIEATEGRQKPEIISALGGREYFLAGAGDAAAAPTPAPLELTPEKIAAAQASLKRLGFLAGEADGVVGPETQAAIRSFQEASGVARTGALDQRTLDAIAVAARFAPPPPTAAATAPAAPQPLAQCPTTFTGRVGDPSELSCLCAPQAMVGAVWGADVYTSDSSICRAALHAGVVDRMGGLVSLRGAPGRAGYVGTSRRGVSTSSWGRYDSSFVFTSETLPEAPAIAISERCPNNLAHLRGSVQSLTCDCAPTQFSGTVWGVDVYTDDSAVCRAALHAGVVDATGGRIEVATAPGRASYQGASRNGVSTSPYGAWRGSFYFPDAASARPSDLPPRCPSSGAGFRGAQERLTCLCEPDQFVGTVWGVDVYTDDSSICNAALHAGAVGGAGGIVSVAFEPGRQSYDGVMRNERLSRSYGPWGGSFRVEAN